MMKLMAVVMFLAVAILTLSQAQASAGTALISAPLPGGDSGLICACTNLSKKPIIIDVVFLSNGTEGYSQIAIASGDCDSRRVDWGTATNCKLSRTDGKSLSTKQVACTLSAIDANGNPTDFVPVNIKYKQ